MRDHDFEAASDGEREWYGINEAAVRLGVTRQSLHQRVGRLQGAQKVDGRWRIPAAIVEALVMAERAKAVAAGSVVALPGAAREDPPSSAVVADLSERVAELERMVLDQAGRFALEVANRDALIAELRADRRRLRRALGTFVEGLAHLVVEDDDGPRGPSEQGLRGSAAAEG